MTYFFLKRRHSVEVQFFETILQYSYVEVSVLRPVSNLYDSINLTTTLCKLKLDLTAKYCLIYV